MTVLGCAGPGPALFPLVPRSVAQLSDGTTERWYDTSASGHADYRELLGPDGRVARIGYDEDEDGRLELDIELAAIPPAEKRHLLVILDSVPFAMVEQIWRQGRLRLFHPPVRVISPFPVMTDLSLSEFFGTSPCPGVESSYYDGQRLTNGYDVYANGGNVPWQRFVDYHLSPVAHVPAYLWPEPWYGHELLRIQETFAGSEAAMTTGYCVGTSALGARTGRNGHQAALVKIDRFCQQAVFRAHGRIQITLMSDHGHYLGPSRRIALPDVLRDLGYHVVEHLEGPGDVVVPEFGMVTCAALHTNAPADVARDVVGSEGIELAAYVDASDQVVVLSREGRATIGHDGAGFRYEARHGDPLGLQPVLEALEKQGTVSPEGFVGDRTLFEATVAHAYPDAVHRLWRAFHGLVEHTPDVLISTEDGYHCGSPLMSGLIRLTGAHGNLRPRSSSAFAITTAGELPAVLRMEDLREALQALGIPIEGAGAGSGKMPSASAGGSGQPGQDPSEPRTGVRGPSGSSSSVPAPRFRGGF